MSKRIIFLFPILGSLIGIYGYAYDLPILFWFGALICLINILLDFLVGLTKSPFIPLCFIVYFAFTKSTWYEGIGFGAIVYTALFTLLGTAFMLIGARIMSKKL